MARALARITTHTRRPGWPRPARRRTAAVPPPEAPADRAPWAGLSRTRLAVVAAATLFVPLSVVLLVPALGGLGDTWGRLGEGDPLWLAAALGFEVASFAGHIVLFRAVAVDAGSRIDMRASYEITMAGHAATRVLATAGAGGVALTAWAMRRSGMERRAVATRMVTFLVLLYSVYMAALVVVGVGLATGLLPGGGSAAMTLVPAAFGALVIAAVLAMPRLPADLGERASARFDEPGRLGRLAIAVAGAPAALGEGVRVALGMARRARPGLLGALAWWGFDIAVLWACLEAFGAAPAVAVVVMAYFVGMLANTLPLPGGVGGVDGGMIGALLAFGVDPSLAVVGVLAYRGFAFWLPIAPGAVAVLQLRRTVARWGREDSSEAPEPVPAPIPLPVPPGPAPQPQPPAARLLPPAYAA